MMKQALTLKNNPGIGFHMTSSRIHAPEISQGPSPQCYDVRFKLTEREKFQNELISQRYKNWKSSSRPVSPVTRNSFVGEVSQRGSTCTGKSVPCQNTQHLARKSPIFVPQEYYDVREKLTDHEKAQISQRYQKKGFNRSPQNQRVTMKSSTIATTMSWVPK